MKRILDIIISSFVLVLLSPIYLIIGTLVFLDLGWPVIDKKNYPGLNEKLFILYRFKTMNQAFDERGQLLLPHERLTKLGNFLTRYSLDHLPEFYNVLIGDMSIVGPRPVLIRTIHLRKRQYLKRHSVRPGIIGWTQLHDKKTLNLEEKLMLDLYYIEHQSLYLDLKIMFKSIDYFFLRKFKKS